MLRRFRFALGPGWILLHLFTVAAVITMILLGRWQLHVSESKHFDIQNFGYTIQWWVFSAFALFFWWRLVRDGAQRHATAPAGPDDADDASSATPAEPQSVPVEPVAYRRYVPPAAPPPADDPVHAAYNDYLAQLAARDAEERSR